MKKNDQLLHCMDHYNWYTRMEDIRHNELFSNSYYYIQLFE